MDPLLVIDATEITDSKDAAVSVEVPESVE
jgi:hypothetical protein